MPSATIAEIDECLRKLPAEKLNIVGEFVAFLLEREKYPENSARATMLASEEVLRKDWDRPEEDAAWAHL